MSPRILVLALVVGILLLPVPVAAKGELPQWAVGDFWQYEGGFLNATDPHDRSERIEVVALSDLVDGRTRPDVGQALELVQTDTAHRSGTEPTATTHLWLRASDHAIAKVALVPSSGNVTLVEEIHIPPFDVYRFPLEVGDAFTANSTSQVLNDHLSVGFRTSAINLSVSGEQDVTVRVGGASRTFSSFVVRQDDSFGLGYTLLYYSDEVGQWVRQEHYARPNASVAEEKDLELSLTAYRYGPSILPIVAIGVIAALVVATVALVWRGRRTSTVGEEKLPPEEPPKKA